MVWKTGLLLKLNNVLWLRDFKCMIKTCLTALILDVKSKQTLFNLLYSFYTGKGNPGVTTLLKAEVNKPRNIHKRYLEEQLSLHFIHVQVGSIQYIPAPAFISPQNGGVSHHDEQRFCSCHRHIESLKKRDMNNDKFKTKVCLLFKHLCLPSLLCKTGILWNICTIWNVKLFPILIYLKHNLVLWYSSHYYQSSVSHDPLEIIIICWFAA